MNLTDLRSALGTIDEQLIAALAARAAHVRNAGLYQPPVPVDSPKMLCANLTHQPDAQAKTRFIRSFYISTVLPLICEEGEDSNPRACLGLDGHCIDMLSKRLNFSNWIAKMKKKDGTVSEVPSESAVTNAKVEQEVLRRVRECARENGLSDNVAAKLADFYRNWIIPTSRLLQVDLLKN